MTAINVAENVTPVRGIVQREPPGAAPEVPTKNALAAPGGSAV